VIVSFLPGDFFGKLFGKKCPNCGKRGFVVLESTEQLSMGEGLHNASPLERGPMVTGRVRDHYYCKNCKEQFTEDHFTF